jgi:hypothetical protein
MRETIEAIIRSIPVGNIFDSHTIIDYLLQNYTDEYLQNCNGRNVETYHSNIANIIAAIADDGLARRIGDSWSKNIHDKFSPCKCWEKL